jgi:hypothetical protein
MTDIIDSLKRLERVGSENSKTTEKLIAAARELSAKIVSHFDNCKDGEIVVASNHDSPMIHHPDSSKPLTPWKHTYRIFDGQLHFDTRRFRSGKVHMDHEYVAADRENAFAFSEDVAAGLLDGIAEALEARSSKSKEVLPSLTAALKK